MLRGIAALSLAFAAAASACGDDLLTQARLRDAGLPEADGGLTTLDSGQRPRPRRDATTAQPDANRDPDAGVPPLPDPVDYDAGFPPPPPDAGFAPDAAPSPRDAGQVARECYTEPFDNTVDISDLERSRTFASIMEALRRRWPAGYDLLYAERNDPYTGSFVDRSSFGSVMESAMTEVHEATHGWDYRHALFRVHFDYYLRADLTFSLDFDVDGFPRSRIRQMIENGSTDLYSGTYLTGEQGSRGLIELLDEMNCYINGLGAIAAIADYVPYGISGRDGAVAFLYYLQLYLRRARTMDPQLHATMLADPVLIDFVKTQWLRAHFFLMFADQYPRVGIHDDEIRLLLYAPHNISEISMLIGRCVDQTNCLCD